MTIGCLGALGAVSDGDGSGSGSSTATARTLGKSLLSGIVSLALTAGRCGSLGLGSRFWGGVSATALLGGDTLLHPGGWDVIIVATAVTLYRTILLLDIFVGLLKANNRGLDNLLGLKKHVRNDWAGIERLLIVTQAYVSTDLRDFEVLVPRYSSESISSDHDACGAGR